MKYNEGTLGDRELETLEEPGVLFGFRSGCPIKAAATAAAAAAGALMEYEDDFIPLCAGDGDCFPPPDPLDMKLPSRIAAPIALPPRSFPTDVLLTSAKHGQCR